MFRNALYVGNNMVATALAAALSIVAFNLYRYDFVTASGVCALLALISLGTRRLRRIDPLAATVSDGWRLYRVVPLVTLARHRLSDFAQLEVRLEKRRSSGDGSSRDYFVLALKPPHGERLHLVEFRDYLKTRRTAERIGRATRLPLLDRSFGVRKLRRWEELDRSLRERLRLSGERLARPALPEGSGIVERQEGGILYLTIPPDATSIPLILAAMTLTLLAAFVGWWTWSTWASWSGMLFIALWVAGGLFLTLSGLTSRFPIEVTLTAGQIAVRQGWWRTRVDVDALEELVLARRQLVFLGDRTVFVFPMEFLTSEQKAEGRYLRDLCTYVIAR